MIKKYFTCLSAIFIVLFLLQGCATPYQPNGFRGGYYDIQLDENKFKVGFSGNGFTSPQRVTDFVLLRSAELALYNGYKYFIIVNSKSYTYNSTYTTPQTANTQFDGYGNARTTFHGGQTYNIAKPSLSNIIVCFKKKPQGNYSYSAEFVYKNITKAYGIR